MERYGIIYKIRNRINNKIYFGQTINTFDYRYQNNLTSQTHNKHLKRSIKKYGIDNFEIDKEFDIAYSKEELDKLEDMYIKIYDTTNPKYGYNMRGGGSFGKITEEQKKKISLANIGRTVSEETRKKISEANSGRNNPNYGKKMLDEQKNKISIARIGKYSGKNNPNYGKHHTNETRIKISEGNKGKHHTEETKIKLSELNKGVNNPRVKKIICMTTGEVFEYASLAIEKYNIDLSNLIKCCRGKQKSAGKHPITEEKLRWMYYEDYIKQQENIA